MNVTFQIPNKDTYISPFTLCPREVLQQSYIDKIGKTIDYFGDMKKVVSVKLTESEIIIELE
jgi:hypothetical protein